MYRLYHQHCLCYNNNNTCCVGNSVNDGFIYRYMNSHVFLNANNTKALYNFQPLASV